MKKVLLLLVALFVVSISVKAGDDRPTTLDKIPQKAQQFVKMYFGDKQVALVTEDSEFMDKSYDVTFTNGDVVEFNKRGEWKNIDCKYSAVPDGVIPTAIQSYVAKNYPNAKVKQLERDRKDYDVELTNGWEIKFDKRSRVIELDR